MSGEAPSWSGSIDTILYKDLVYTSYQNFLTRQRFNLNILRSLLATATGTDLDGVVALKGITRQTGETDDPLRVRGSGGAQGIQPGKH